MEKEKSKFCDRCDGSGKLRANYMKDGKYVIHKEVCYKCKGAGIKKSFKTISHNVLSYAKRSFV